MSQIRFDREGRIALRQDFWNPATGTFQHLPPLEPATRFANGPIGG